MANQGGPWGVLVSMVVTGVGLFANISQAGDESRFLPSQFAVCAFGQVPVALPISMASPDGRVRVEFSLRAAGEVQDVPHYRVIFRDHEVVGPSRLGVELEGGMNLGGSSEVEAAELRSVREEYTQFPGKRRGVTGSATELTVRLREKTEPRRTWDIVLRAYDDGAAFRYRLPKQDGWESLVIARERTEFRLPADGQTFALPLNGFISSFENRYLVAPAGELPRDSLLGLPLLCGCQNGDWLAITEANVAEYAGMYLVPNGGGLLQTRLSPLPHEPKVAVRAALPHASPWRVVMLGDRVGRLVESDIVLNLSDPREIEDTSWIKPGKTTFPWWNGFHEEGVPFKPGLNTATAKYYIDFCAQAGIPYHSLDGMDNTAWYGGPIVPYEGAGLTQGVAGLDLAEVLKHAQAKGVRIRLWMHWKAAEAHMEQAFPQFHKWGIEGVMLDFMDRDDQEMNRFVRHAVKLAAENQLTITLHGCPKPTGLERTYPNLLTHEGVLNLEYDKWDKLGVTPDHELIVPFTRMLAGPLDFHQGSFRTVKQAEFKPRNEAPFIIGTPARTLASYVVYQNHLSMVADYPSAYRDHPGLPVLAAIPTSWDDTKVLDAKVGQFVVIARRNGNEWYVGAMTDGQPRSFDIPLGFLAQGRYQAEIVADDDTAKPGLVIHKQFVTADDKFRLKLTAGGGGLMRIAPVP